MTPRLAQLPAADVDDDGLTVAQAARSLGCDPSTVRKLLRRRRLRAWRVGLGDQPRGVRISSRSVEAWKRRHAAGDQVELEAPAPRPTRRQASAAVNEAIAELRALGVAV